MMPCRWLQMHAAAYKCIQLTSSGIRITCLTHRLDRRGRQRHAAARLRVPIQPNLKSLVHQVQGCDVDSCSSIVQLLL